MSRRVYTYEHFVFLRCNYKKMHSRDLTELFNKYFGMNQTEPAIRTIMLKNGIYCGRSGSDRLTPPKTPLFSKIEKAFVKREFKNHKIPALAKLFNKHFGTARNAGQIRNLIAREKFTCGRDGSYKKKNKPWNAGTKGQGLTGANKRSFKKGSIPPNRKPLGTERVSPDGFIEIKVAETNPNTGFPTRYKHKHRHIWEQVNGPIPEDGVIAFKDSDKSNCDPANLMLVTRAELLALNQNGYRTQPVELKPTVRVLSKLQAKRWETGKRMRERQTA